MTTRETDAFDDWLDGPVSVGPTPVGPSGNGTATKPPVRQRPDREEITGFAAVPGAVFVFAEALAIGFGAFAISSGVAWLALIGYLFCGVALPVMWAGFYVRQKMLSRSGEKTDPDVLIKANQWLLIVGLVVAMVSFYIAATAWAKG